MRLLRPLAPPTQPAEVPTRLRRPGAASLAAAAAVAAEFAAAAGPGPVWRFGGGASRPLAAATGSDGGLSFGSGGGDAVRRGGVEARRHAAADGGPSLLERREKFLHGEIRWPELHALNHLLNSVERNARPRGFKIRNGAISLRTPTSASAWPVAGPFLRTMAEVFVACYRRRVMEDSEFAKCALAVAAAAAGGGGDGDGFASDSPPPRLYIPASVSSLPFIPAGSFPDVQEWCAAAVAAAEACPAFAKALRLSNARLPAGADPVTRVPFDLAELQRSAAGAAAPGFLQPLPSPGSAPLLWKKPRERLIHDLLEISPGAEPLALTLLTPVPLPATPRSPLAAAQEAAQEAAPGPASASAAFPVFAGGGGGAAVGPSVSAAVARSFPALGGWMTLFFSYAQGLLPELCSVRVRVWGRKIHLNCESAPAAGAAVDSVGAVLPSFCALCDVLACQWTEIVAAIFGAGQAAGVGGADVGAVRSAGEAAAGSENFAGFASGGSARELTQRVWEQIALPGLAARAPLSCALLHELSGLRLAFCAALWRVRAEGEEAPLALAGEAEICSENINPMSLGRGRKLKSHPQTVRCAEPPRGGALVFVGGEAHPRFFPAADHDGSLHGASRYFASPPPPPPEVSGAAAPAAAPLSAAGAELTEISKPEPYAAAAGGAPASDAAAAVAWGAVAAANFPLSCSASDGRAWTPPPMATKAAPPAVPAAAAIYAVPPDQLSLMLDIEWLSDFWQEQQLDSQPPQLPPTVLQAIREPEGAGPPRKKARFGGTAGGVDEIVAAFGGENAVTHVSWLNTSRRKSLSKGATLDPYSSISWDFGDFDTPSWSASKQRADVTTS